MEKFYHIGRILCYNRMDEDGNDNLPCFFLHDGFYGLRQRVG